MKQFIRALGFSLLVTLTATEARALDLVSWQEQDVTIGKGKDALHGTLANAEVRARIEDQGADTVASEPEQCRAFLAREVEKWDRAIRGNNITLES